MPRETNPPKVCMIDDEPTSHLHPQHITPQHPTPSTHHHTTHPATPHSSRTGKQRHYSSKYPGWQRIVPKTRATAVVMSVTISLVSLSKISRCRSLKKDILTAITYWREHGTERWALDKEARYAYVCSGRWSQTD